MAGQIQKIPTAHERLEELGARVLSDAELFTILLGPAAGANNVREAAARLIEQKPLSEIAWASADELQQVSGIGPARAAAVVAAFELGRRGDTNSPVQGCPGSECPEAAPVVPAVGRGALGPVSLARSLARSLAIDGELRAWGA